MVSISDVAKDAGVSASTVSYALSGKRSISAETQRRVETSIRRLGYHPHAGARALASSRTSVLALVMPLRTDIHMPAMMRFVTSMATAARAHDYDLLLLTSDEGPAGLRRVANSAMADAFLVMEVEADDPRIPVLRELSRPAVLIGLPDDPGGLPCVDLDFTAAAKRCVAELGDAGHRDVALIGSPPVVYERGTSFATRFLRGFDEAVRDRGMRGSSRSCAPDYDAVRACLGELLEERPEITGLVVHNEAALGSVLAELHNSGRHVPEDISVVAVGQDSAAHREVPLTTVPLPTEDMVRIAVELAMRALQGSGAPETRLLAPQVVPGKSVEPRR
ncbi:LacI family DNA-binding transcriptional regulator [Saccharopolyspora griseoalba]|uniref:LacI family DNA-binding transcriptional regulator n=1 Tax=Saccharopolyspora griseoalba TaxID=1431848 RepID=A0ABW2LPD0_9PSEU